MRVENRKVAGLLAALTAFPALAQDPGADPAKVIEDFKKRIAQLEQRVDELEIGASAVDEKLGSRAMVQAYSAESFDFGGQISSLWSHIRGENDDTTGSFATFTELFLKARLGEGWSLFATPGFATASIPLVQPDSGSPFGIGNWTQLDTGDLAAGVVMTRAYLEYYDSDALFVRAGIFGTPHGVINREYFLTSRITALSPLSTRTFAGNDLFAQTSNGVLVGGRKGVGAGGNEVQYEAYAGFSREEADEPEFGARLGWYQAESRLNVAANWGRGHRPATDNPAFPVPGVPALPQPGMYFPFPLVDSPAHDYQFAGLDVDWRMSELWLQAEAYRSWEVGLEDRQGVWVQPTWWLGHGFGLSYRFDYFDIGMNLGHATENVFSLVFDPNESVRLRIDYHHVEMPGSPDTSDIINFSFSAGF